MQKVFYRAAEAATYLGCAKSTIWMYAKQGRLSPKSLSKRVTIFHIDDLNNLINGDGKGNKND